MGAQHAGGPILSGAVPPLAPYFSPRRESGFGLADGLRPGETTLLVPAILGAGGMGKTQLAVGFTRALRAARAVDLIAWIPAGDRSWVIAGLARAAADLELTGGRELTAGLEPAGDQNLAGGAQESADSAALRFLAWLAKTERRWAVVLDDVVSPADLDGLWPQGPAGQVIVTSRLTVAKFTDARLAGTGAAGTGLFNTGLTSAQVKFTAHAVAGFSRRESLAYLNGRLTDFADQRVEAIDLAEDLGGVPLAVAQAAAFAATTKGTCKEYRAKYAERLAAIGATVVSGCPQAALTTGSLAAETARKLSPASLSWPALVFASAFGTTGIPAAVLTSPAACAYITGHPAADPDGASQASGSGEDGRSGSSAGQDVRAAVRAAYGNLELLGLLGVDSPNLTRTVWPQYAVRAVVRRNLSASDIEQAAAAAAAALVEAWPPGSTSNNSAPGSSPQLSAALREAARGLRDFAGDLLWEPDAHPVLLRAGASLTEPPALAESAIEYWQEFSAASARLPGTGQPQAVHAKDQQARDQFVKDQLLAAHAASGRLAEALPLFEKALADREAVLGPQHLDTVAVRQLIARSLRAAGKASEAVALFEQVSDTLERTLGHAHAETLAAQFQLAGVYEEAGRHYDSLTVSRRIVVDAERELGTDHPTALAARAAVAGAFRAAGKHAEAVKAYERVLADRTRALGGDHPDTIAARASLGAAYRASGQLKDAIRAYERVATDRERVLGAEHPDALTIRCNLAAAYLEAGRMADGVKLLRRALADCERYLGTDHPMTAVVRENLQAATQ